MNAELLRGWLGLAEAVWPPDAHTLLGVTPGERDLARIEHQVQERLAKLRCHQISYPEEATEGMNRLAQAFVELMDGCPKSGPRKEAARGASVPPVETVETETVVDRKTELDWKAAPPPIREAARHGEAPSGTPSEPASANGKKEIPKALPAPSAVANSQMIRHLAQQSAAARAGLGTLEAVIRRVDETRRVLIAWNNAGRWLREPKRRLVRPADDADLARRLDAIDDALSDFPAILGQPGTPGYRVAATARLQLNSLLVRGMDLEHRELLSLDWVNGRNILLEYRRFLRQHFKTLRKRGPVALMMHALRWFVNDHPIVMAVVLAALAGVAIWVWRAWK
jgi:hypothetical protein